MINKIVKLITIVLIFSVVGCSQKTDVSNNTAPTNTEEPVLETIAPVDNESDLTMDVDFADELSLVGYGAKGALDDDNLSIKDMLMYAVQDEYLARDEYTKIMEVFDVDRPYSNIKKSEETHLQLLEDIYTTYDLEFPENTAIDHVVVPSSLLEAAETGVQEEIDNIAMYEKFLVYNLPEDVADTFTKLKNASESHLLAFKKQVETLS